MALTDTSWHLDWCWWPATDAIPSGVIDLAAFGRPLLANPDFVERLRTGMPLVPYEPAIHLKSLL